MDEQLKAKIVAKKLEFKIVSAELANLKEQCTHEMRPLTKKELDDKWMSVDALCVVCGKSFGWRCKVSPDGVCHYFSEDGKVELIDGTFVDIPIDHDPEYETDDGCIFCGHPDERK